MVLWNLDLAIYIINFVAHFIITYNNLTMLSYNVE